MARNAFGSAKCKSTRRDMNKDKKNDMRDKMQQIRQKCHKKSTNSFLIGIQLLMFLVILNYYVDMVEASEDWSPYREYREPRKMFGGYRITPTFCTPTRPSTRLDDSQKGPSICMFNYECTQRKGEVVGACVDGFLFGACCRLPGTSGVIKDSVSSGVVVVLDEQLSKKPGSGDDVELGVNMKFPMLSEMSNKNTYMIRTTERTTELQGSSPHVQINNNHADHPSTLAVSMNYLGASTEKIKEDPIYGLGQIASSLLQTNPNSDVVTVGSESNSGELFSHSTISHEEADTILVTKNGTINVSRPSDFTSPAVEISTMQTKPAPIRQTTQSANHKPIFRPKPGKKPTQDKFVLVPSPTKPHTPVKNSEMSSIESIMNMLNDTHPSTISTNDVSGPENRITTLEMSKSTVSPLSYSSGYPPTHDYLETITKKPNIRPYVTTASNSYTTYQQPSTSYVYSSTLHKRPGSEGSSGSTSKYPNKYTSNSVFYTKRPTVLKDGTKPTTQSTTVESSTLSFEDYWGNNPKTTSKPPSTSYIYSATPTKRPISSVPNIIEPNFDVSSSYDTFSSVTPTVIVLSSPNYDDYSHTPNPEKYPDRQPVEAQQDNQDNFVEVPLKPHKKPVHQVTINNIITSNNMIHLAPNKPTTEKAPPTVVITPKPNSATTNSNTKPASPARPAVSIENPDGYDASTVTTTKRPTKKPVNKKPTTKKPQIPSTTIKNEILPSADELINFPPVRNPNLNTTGVIPTYYNNSVSVGIDDVVLQEVEFTTPAYLQEDEELNEKMSLFVNKIVSSFQGTFQELHDIVILDKAPNATSQNNKVKPGSTQSDDVKPTKKPTSKPGTTKKPTRATVSTTTRRSTTSKKPARITTTATPTTTTTTTTTTPATTKKPVRTTVSTKKPKPAKTTLPPTTVPTTIVTDAQVLEEEDYTTETPDGEHRLLCGVRPMVKSGRIVGGKGATFGEWPWQVLVRESTWLGLFTKNKCGGVLITNRFVTTAAHCQPGFLASLVAVFGKFDISSEVETKRSITKNVRRVIIHRQYDAATFENDLALLELESPVHYDTHIVPICMPSDDADFTGRMATVTGWGRLKYGGGVPSVLQEVKVPIMENSVCQEMFHTAGHTKVILNSFLCAGYANGQKDSCEGDSGGPLVLQRPDGRWELAGTVSHGIKCAAPYLPGVYMRTTFYKPWLRSITGVQ